MIDLHRIDAIFANGFKFDVTLHFTNEKNHTKKNNQKKQQQQQQKQAVS